MGITGQGYAGFYLGAAVGFLAGVIVTIVALVRLLIGRREGN